MRLPAILPDAFLRCLSEADRRAIAPGQLTSEQAVARIEIKSERQLQGLLVGLLRVRGIEPLWFRTDKRTRATVGWPDITFALRGIAVAWEVKLPGEKPRPEQLAMHEALKRDGWAVSVITGFNQGRNYLDTFRPEAHLKFAAAQKVYASQYGIESAKQ